MSCPCPPCGDMITLKIGLVVPVGTPPASISTYPKVYPEPWFETWTSETWAFSSIVIVHVAPCPSPLIGILLYWTLADPTEAPLLVTVITLIDQ